jgi:hypothetical protein
VHLPWLVESFDRLLRFNDEPASESSEVADILQSTSQSAVATVKEIVNG